MRFQIDICGSIRSIVYVNKNELCVGYTCTVFYIQVTPTLTALNFVIVLTAIWESQALSSKSILDLVALNDNFDCSFFFSVLKNIACTVKDLIQCNKHDKVLLHFVSQFMINIKDIIEGGMQNDGFQIDTRSVTN